uniref:Xaa-Pro aminopeptidase 1 n=2 Tax=Lygus hesperus TaxID=30085 RepID=A0A0A9ZGQ6_LYGHE
MNPSPGVAGSNPDAYDKLEKLRKCFSDKTFNTSPISAYIIPHDDQHMSEYLAETDKRLEHISGFTGSAGTVVITMEKALLWTDGRYFIQAGEELLKPFELMKIEGPTSVTPGEWLASNLNSGERVGGDPALFSCAEWRKIKNELNSNAVQLIESNSNLVDHIWTNKPGRPINEVVILEDEYSGRPMGDKIMDVVAVMKDKKSDIHVVSELDNVAWLLNLRGTDISYNPVFFSFVIIQIVDEEVVVYLFIDQAKLSPAIVSHIFDSRICLKICDYSNVYTELSGMAKIESTKRVWISTTSNYKLLSLVPKNKRFLEPSIVTKLKSVKNAVEAKGMVNAHIKDGYALCSFLQWLEENMLKGTHLTEISAADKLQEFRSKEEGFRGLSFPTISSVGAHAAIIHYQPSSYTDAALSMEEIYLVDSGGQYLDGTTDVTRTVHFGNPCEFEKECFTRVLKGVISLNTAIFPANLKGNVLDSFARRALWDVGLQYGHGTGHGIGAHLCVHEGPIGVSWRPLPNDPGLDENMFISNEPGYYKENHFGVRIENIEQIIRVAPVYDTPHKFLTLKTITLCPIQTKLIDPNLLNAEELKWLNDYHEEIRQTLVPIAERKGNLALKNWLIKETEALMKS